MKKILSIFTILVMVFSVSVFAEETAQTGKAASKLARGLTNLATCWGEYFMQLPEAEEKSPDYLTGLFYDIFRGTAFTIRRAVVGIYDIISFPFPGKTNYGPVIKPATVVTPTAEALTH